MTSYHNAVNPTNANQSVAFKTLNGHGSASTFQSKLEVDNELPELQQLRRHKEDSEAIVNNLRKTIKDMAKQMSQLESRAQSYEQGPSLKNTKELTPSLSTISPSCNGAEEERQPNLRFLESQL